MARVRRESGRRTELERLLSERIVMCLASASVSGPWCAPLFFAPVEGGRTLVFLSDPKSRHARELAADPRAAAGLYLETRSTPRIRGLQLEGSVERLTGAAQRAARKAWLGRFPGAAGLLSRRPHERFFAFHIRRAKLTDNRKGFGHKELFDFTAGGTDD